MNLPNLITLSRVPALFVVAALLYASPRGCATAAFAIFVLGALTDWLDGFLARRSGQISDFGKLMDALTDKILVVGVMVAMLVPPTEGTEPLLPTWAAYLVLMVLAREFLITGLRLIAVNQGFVLAAERSGKIKTVMFLVGIPSLLLWHALKTDFGVAASTAAFWQWLGLGLFVGGSILAASSGAGYLIKYWDVFMGHPVKRPGK